MLQQNVSVSFVQNFEFFVFGRRVFITEITKRGHKDHEGNKLKRIVAPFCGPTLAAPWDPVLPSGPKLPLTRREGVLVKKVEKLPVVETELRLVWKRSELETAKAEPAPVWDVVVTTTCAWSVVCPLRRRAAKAIVRSGGRLHRDWPWGLLLFMVAILQSE